jgi:thiamine biosynthesis lipoprotein
VHPSLVTADIDATAAFALGEDGPGWLARRPGRTGIVVHAGGRVELVGEAATGR